MEFYMPGRLITGENCVEASAERIASLGKRCLLITSGSAAGRSGALAEVESVLKRRGIDFERFGEIAPNPTLRSCQEGGQQAHAFGAEFLIGIGGGSPLDAAKAISVFAANPGMDEAGFYSADWPGTPLPTVLIGTTAGTGSEVTSVSVLTDSRGRKHSIHDDRLYAALALGDPRYTLSLPRPVTLSTGIDAISHCVESYFSRKADTLSRLFAEEGVRLAYPILCAAAEPEAALSLAQRDALYRASILGGLAINRTGTVFPHNVGYYLTENFGVPHGYASAAFLPELLSHARNCEPELTSAFYAKTGLGEEQLPDLVSRVMPPLNVTITEEELQAALPRWASNGSVRNTVGEVGLDQIAAMLRKDFR